ncbi:Transposon protein, putative, CACTA, En/Spm sub-class [Quillaja saponaria]|uniref:Transposon protein, putative, CACTA, En/Spm sub-class n=1 Tax=Quillaja saponaria TaxID=32244 RepID=A0AAD7VHB8_QUISA|nr:Transposon protein, putative, CACTA, En/Spm sub-class [Quillaja saponaria]
MALTFVFLETNFIIAVLVLTAILYLIPKHRASKVLPLPPGPYPWPQVGNLPHIGNKLHVVLTQLAQAYGPLMTLRLGSQLLVVGSSSAAAMEILKTHDRILSGRHVPYVLYAKPPELNHVSIGWTYECICKNKKWKLRDEVAIDLYKKGFVKTYKWWTLHGEAEAWLGESSNNRDVDVGNSSNPYVDMVLDAAGPDFNWDDESRIREEPNCDAQNFYDLLKNADEPLWEGCDWHSRLSAVTQLLNCKSEFNMSESLYDRLISIIKGMLPKDEKLPENFYRSKQMVKKLGLGYEKIHVCPNDCMLYYGEEDKKLRECRICGHSRYQPKTRSSKIDVPYKILRHFPLAPRLQRLFMSKNTAQHMTWHDQRRANGIMIHPSDGEAWKHFDDNYPSFSDEPRNIRLGLATDGFCPFGHSSNGHSIWPVFVTPYNLPPNMCMKEQYLFLTLVIPGPKSPKQNLDIYLRPLIDDLKKLWNVGVNTYNAYRGENFIMRAALMWTISDFPAYGMLSGWSTHGNLACPYCMEQTKSFRLPHSHKQCWFDCHRQFLPIDHPFRKQKDKLKKNTTEKALPPPRLSGEEVWDRLRRLNQITFGNAFGKKIISGFGKQHNWAKISIFWELPYWSTNLIRHNLDVMHIEKNVFDNVFNTVMNMKGKTKDNPNGRMDL